MVDATELDELVRRSREFLTRAIETALGSPDPALRELAGELKAGRITPLQAASNGGYQEILRSGFQTQPDPPADAAPDSRPRGARDDDDDFSTRTFMHRVREDRR